MRLCKVELRKVKGTVKPADLFIKYIDARAKIENLVELFSCFYREGAGGDVNAIEDHEEDEFADMPLMT